MLLLIVSDFIRIVRILKVIFYACFVYFFGQFLCMIGIFDFFTVELGILPEKSWQH